MKQIQKIVALLCAVALIVCAIPTAALAQGDATTATAETVTPIDTSTVSETVSIENLTVADIVGEDESRRDATTKHFMLTDGSMVAVSYPLAVHENVGDEWVPIDNSLHSATDSDGDSVEQTTSQNIKFSFVNGKGNDRLVKVEDTTSKAQIIFELENANKKALVLSETAESDELFAVSNVVQKGTYTDILEDTDIEYIIAGTTLKENIIVKNAAAMGAVSFVLRCKNVTASLQEDNSVLFTDADGNTVFTIPAPFMYDATGAYSDAVAVSLTPHKKGYLYTVTPDKYWAQDAARVYPVTIDPAVESDLSTEAVSSAFVKESDPTYTAGNETFMWVGNNTSTKSCYGLVKVTLPTLSAADYVVRVDLRLYTSRASDNMLAGSGWSAWNADYLNGSMVLQAHAITGTWNETTVTWNTCPKYNNRILDAVKLTSANAPTIIGAEYQTTDIHLDITELGKSWYNGTANNGVLLKLNNENTHTFAAEFFSDYGYWQANGNMIVHPCVSVSYRSKAGLEDVYSYSSVSAGEAGTGYVQLNSGNLVFVHDGLSLMGTDPTVAIKHVYNTCNIGVNNGYGYGWTLNYAQTLVKKTIGGRSYYAYTDADATVHYFDVTESKSEYEDESGLELKLVLGSAHHTVKDKDNNQLLFHPSGAGRLWKILDTYGRRVLVEYNANGRIAKITDGADRVYSFGYANNMLSTITSPDGRVMGYNYSSLRLTSVRGSKNGAVYEDNTYAYAGTTNVLVQAKDQAGNFARMENTAATASSRVKELRSKFSNNNGNQYTRSFSKISYRLHETTVTDADGLKVTYQFDAYGLTRCIYNSDGQAQYFRYYAPNAQNENGASTYGPNKLEASSQTHYVVNNLLYDHSFEAASSKWTGNFQRKTNKPYEGAYSLVFVSPNLTDNKTASQTVTLTKGATYTLSAYVFAEDNTVTLSAVLADGSATLNDVTLKDNRRWERMQCTFTVPTTASTANVAIRLNAASVGTTYIDAVQLEKNVTANRYNLLQNSDLSYYESSYSAPYGWTYSSSGTAGVVGSGNSLGNVAPSSIGLNSGHYATTSWQHAYNDHGNATNPTQALFSTTLAQTVALGAQSSGTTLSYGAWMQADSLPYAGKDGKAATFGVKIDLLDTNGTVVQTQTTPANAFCEDWQFVGDVIVAKKGFAKAKLTLLYQNNVNWAHFDGAFVYADYFGQSFAYDDDGNIISTTAYADQKSTFEYSASDDLLSSVSPEGAKFNYTYNEFHDVKTGTSAEGVTYAYDYEENKYLLNAGQVQSAQTVLGTAMNTATVENTFESNFLTSQSTTDVRGNAVTYTYNRNGTIATATDATGVVTSYTYDSRLRNTGVTATKDGAVLSTVTYVYDAYDRLSEIQNGDVRYFFTYDVQGRVVKVSVGTDSGNTLTLSQTVYVDKTANGTGYNSTQVEIQEYGNGDKKVYNYDARGRVIGVKYDTDTAWRYTYTYDTEGNLAALKDTVSGTTVRYEYDLSKRLSRIIQSDGYTLTYEYNAENALVGVTESVSGGVANTTRYVYNKDNLVTKVTSPTGKAVYYDYSYNRKADRYYKGALHQDVSTYGFKPVDGATIEEENSAMSPVGDDMTVKITRTSTVSAITNNNAVRVENLRTGHRYVLSYWYKAEPGATGELEATLKFNVSNANNVSQDTVSTAIVADDKWHYVECLLTANGDLYGTAGDYVSPALTWTTSDTTGTVYINGISFAEEYDTVMFATDLKKATIQSAGTTVTAVTDNDAPNPAVVREWKKTGGSTQSISHRAGKLFTTTPQPGEIWEFTFEAKVVSGSQGNGFMVSFRADAADNAAVSDEEYITLDPENDNAWHSYTRYVTVNADAYKNCSQITPYFGWINSTAAGVVRVSGITVRKVGNQWNNAAKNFGFVSETSGLSVTSATDNNAPIAYQDTVKLAYTSTADTVQVNAPLASFPQPEATDTWTLSFWAKVSSSGSALFKRTGQTVDPVQTWLTADNQWHYYTVPLTMTNGVTLKTMMLGFTLFPQTELYLNGVNLVPGSVALANDSGQNSAALKNITIDTGTTKFNTAIEYDTDANRHAYSRVKHYINNGKAYSYEYDTAGNISKIISPDGSWVSYTYDALNQLTAEHHSAAVSLASLIEGGGTANAVTEGVSCDTVEYTYDTRGNILSKTYSLDGTTVTTVTYNYTDTKWKDRLTSLGGNTISYDEIGNPLNWTNGETLTWQRGRQLASFTRGDTTAAYAYDVDGIRTSKTVNGITTTYTHVDGTLRRMSIGNNTIEFYDNSVLYNGTEYWYVYNVQNDVIGLIDASGSYVVEYTYDSWGQLLSTTGSMADTLGKDNPFRYRGYIYDEETGWYYCNTRYYDPVIGRFLNSDNEALVTATPEVAHWDKNLYAYCDNNPVVRYDISGQFWETVFDVVSLGTSIVEVCVNPTDPWAWAGLAGDAIDLIPFVTGAGEITRSIRITNAVIEVADTTTDVARDAKKVSTAAERSRAVRKAWDIEYNNAHNGGNGFSRHWTDMEKVELLKRGKVSGYQGHHMYSVKGYPELAGNPYNIQFLTRTEHLLAHRGNWKNVTSGRYITSTYTILYK